MSGRNRRNSRVNRSRVNRNRKRRPVWSDWSDDDLLDLRLCDLGITMDDFRGSFVERCLHRLHDELDERGIRHRPHCWISSEWFSPDGTPGIGVPFYLAHPRLMRLEKKMMLQVEGGRERDCMKIFRHEAGHTVCTAYRLHYRRRWREVFGRFSEPYPDSYKPRPNSRDYVLHLDWWYAQVHPAEDFAETFAVWLRPGSRWRSQYRGWPALRKLEFVDELMQDIAGRAQKVRTRRQIEPLKDLTRTLREHYRRKRRWYGEEWPEFYDRDLRKIFSEDPKYAQRMAAATFLRRVRPEIRQVVAAWTGTSQYTIDQVLRDMIDRCRELNLRLAIKESEARIEAKIMVTVQTMNYIHGGHYRIAL